MARRMSATGDRDEVLVQALVLKSPDDLSDLDIVEFWNVENGVVIEFSKDGAKRLERLAAGKKGCQMAIVTEGKMVTEIVEIWDEIKDGRLEIRAEERRPSHDRLFKSFRVQKGPQPLQFVRSYVEGE
jgi:hypothetical protein